MANAGVEFHRENLFGGSGQNTRLFADIAFVEEYFYDFEMTQLQKRRIPRSTTLDIGFEHSFLNNKLFISGKLRNVTNEKTLSELEHVFELVQKGFAMSIDTLSTGNLVKVKEVITIEREIDRLKIEIRDKYMKRMNKGIASAESGIFVMDLLSNLERISDHFRNIGETVQRLGRPVVVTE